MKTKIIRLFIMVAVIFSTGILSAQTETDTEKMNPVIMQGVESAKDGIEYWDAETERCIHFELSTETSVHEVKKWSAEITFQLNLAKTLAEKNASLNSYSRYLKLAYRTLEVLKGLNSDLKLPQLKIIISGLETAIKLAEKIISIFK